MFCSPLSPLLLIFILILIYFFSAIIVLDTSQSNYNQRFGHLFIQALIRVRQEDLDDRPVWVHSKMISKKENEILPSFPSEKGTHSSNSQYWLASCCFFLTLFSSLCMHWHVPYPFSSSCPSAGGSLDIIHLLCRSNLQGNPTFIDARTVHCAFSLSFYSYQIPKHILKVIFLSNVISTFLFNSLLFNILFLLLGIL